jgi:aromatic-L-amino-acid/L-tryptophan decarboxylase
LWLSLRYHGLSAFRQAVAQDLRHAQQLAMSVDSEPRLERLAPVELSAVCFRCRAAGTTPVDTLNRAVLKRVIERGRVYISNTVLRGAFALRACFVNHRTTGADVDAVVHEVLAAATDVLK